MLTPRGGNELQTCKHYYLLGTETPEAGLGDKIVIYVSIYPENLFYYVYSDQFRSVSTVFHLLQELSDSPPDL